MNFLDITSFIESVSGMLPLGANPSTIPVINNNDMSIARLILGKTYPDDNLDKIEIRDVDSEENYFGMYRRYRDNQVIIAISTTRTCWKRFLITKELCHIFVDQNAKTLTTNIEALVSDIVSKRLVININTNTQPIPGEYLTILFACELLVPYKFNSLLLTKEISYSIAEQFKVPEQMIDLMRTKWYQELRTTSYTTS